MAGGRVLAGAALLGLLGLLALLGLVAACGGGGDDAGSGGSTGVTVTVEGLAAPLLVEVADDRGERARGLSGRAEVPEGTGMLFRYDSADQREFWMRDTLVPLDIAWVRDGTVVGVTTMQPCVVADSDDCERYASPGKVDSALEAQAGSFQAVRSGAAVRVQD